MRSILKVLGLTVLFVALAVIANWFREGTQAGIQIWAPVGIGVALVIWLVEAWVLQPIKEEFKRLHERIDLLEQNLDRARDCN